MNVICVPPETEMPSPEFTKALPFILRWEGGFVNHPNDPGGATNKGVTQAVYNDWRGRQGLPEQDVRELSDTELMAIYEGGYWTPARCPLMAGPLDQVQFDTAVNMGVGRAVRFLQHAVGAAVDGAFGPDTQRCLGACEPADAVVKYCDAREAFYRNLAARRPDSAVFLKGWLNRLNALRKEIGLPGFESVGDEVNFGDANFIARIPDIGQDPAYD
ncbi:MAG: glycoside hydrolase family 108 protein [Hyphomicrobiaceae bacterium]|nr:glycoside hydrolase family 108 protein [Hyphomicrobiaceae bacterium]